MDDDNEQLRLLHSEQQPEKRRREYDSSEVTRMWFIQNNFGITLSILVWILLLYSEYVLVFIIANDQLYFVHGIIVSILVILALWAHLKVMVTNPGTVPKNAKPLSCDDNRSRIKCGKCKCYKPPMSHHGKIIDK